jgi:predicted RNA-binding Zn-ribbon protein involved in translation (DUF1610 family)
MIGEAEVEVIEVEVKQVVDHNCPSCGETFQSEDDYRNHWINMHASPQTQSAQASSQQSAGVETRKVVKVCCPSCSETFPTESECRTHWLAQHAPKAPISPEGGMAEASSSSQQPLDQNVQEGLEGSRGPGLTAGESVGTKRQAVETLKSDEKGRPVIIRTKDLDSGSCKTVVLNEDGSQRVFGEGTINSMIENTEEDIGKWLDHMSDLHLRGLVHEVTERVCRGSEEYHVRKKYLEKRSEERYYSFFGLSPLYSCERELDGAYRRLAREMHPDKNGGTEIAKQRFQVMKRKYEELKLRIPKEPRQRRPCSSRRTAEAPAVEAPAGEAPAAEDQAAEDQAAEDQVAESPAAEDPVAEDQAAEAPAAESSAAEEEKPTENSSTDNPGTSTDASHSDGDKARWFGDSADMVINAFTDDRNELEPLAWKMLKQLKVLKHQRSKLEAEYPEAEDDDDLVGPEQAAVMDQ